jgi:hypothetical protein
MAPLGERTMLATKLPNVTLQRGARDTAGPDEEDVNEATGLLTTSQMKQMQQFFERKHCPLNSQLIFRCL